MSRPDDFLERSKHLTDMSEDELEARFWALSEKLVEPIVELAVKNTSPSIERSILLRMGFSSIEAKSIVDNAIDKGLIGKGVGHIVFRLAKERNADIRETGLTLIDEKNWEEVLTIFKGGAN